MKPIDGSSRLARPRLGPSIVCINLDRRPDRWQAMESQFRRLGLRVRRFAALEGLATDPNPTGLTLGQLGCAKSHLAVLRWATRRGLTDLVVLEDDVRLAEDFAARLKIVGALPSRRPLCLLSALFWAPAPLPETPRQLGVELDWSRVPVPAGIHGYLVRKEGFAPLIAALSPLAVAADDAFGDAVRKGLGLSVAVPFLTTLARTDGEHDAGDVCPDGTTREDIARRQAAADRSFVALLPPAPARPTICLSMIVKNEAHVVTEVLACVAPHIDTWVIVDTGSTDETISTIRSFFAGKAIPGEIHERPWLDFGANRTEALELCRGKADYSWVIDADDLVVGKIDLSALCHDSYLLRYGPDFRYWRKQIFRSSLPWQYRGRIHEYPICLMDSPSESRLEGSYHVESRRLGDRSRAADKYQRDCQLLLEELKNDPGDARSVFYLGQSYFDAGDFNWALHYYALRASMGGWGEEVFYSLLRVAACLERLGASWDEVLESYLECWQSRPERAEPLHEIARHYRLEGKFHLAHLFATRASQLSFPEGDGLFVAADVYEWRALDELAIAAFFVGSHRESFDVCNRLLDCASVPEGDRDRILGNRDFAVPHVKDETLAYPQSIVRRLTARSVRRLAPRAGRKVAEVSKVRVTLTITTCKRLELFVKTMSSFLNCCEDIDAIGRFICVDDGSSEQDRRRMAELYPFFEFVFKDAADKGHAKSMNALVGRVESPFFIHLEDDWHFFVKDRYVEKAVAILEDDPKLEQVLFNRNYGETLSCRGIRGGTVKRTRAEGLRYRIHEHAVPGTSEYLELAPRDGPSNTWWPHYSLRPSLSRTASIREIGAYDPAADHFELSFARAYAERGFRSAFFDTISCLHIGRLTSERGLPGARPNAYELNEESQFVRKSRDRVFRVKLIADWTSSEHLCRLWNRQSKGENRWDDIEVTAEDRDIDYWVIVNRPGTETLPVPKDRTVVLHMEPRRALPTWGDWAEPDPREFLQVRSHDRYRNNSEWHLAMTWQELASQSPEKSKDLSSITSGKFSDPGQRLRVLFLKHLEEQGTKLDIFGSDNTQGFLGYRGRLPDHDKRDGILPYRYTIAVENHAEVNYFTEKIVDAILGECLCFYWGCPNLEEYL
ncbi:MAG: glycosyltransferase family 25 protein, partial [Thermoanaerobaculia bacterium]